MYGREYYEALKEFRTLKSNMRDQLRNEIDNIPNITANNPYKWEYQVIGLAIGKSTTGTGLFSEFEAPWTNFLGMQSEDYHKKIAAGEMFCARQMRSKLFKWEEML